MKFSISNTSCTNSGSGFSNLNRTVLVDGTAQALLTFVNKGANLGMLQPVETVSFLINKLVLRKVLLLLLVNQDAIFPLTKNTAILLQRSPQFRQKSTDFISFFPTSPP